MLIIRTPASNATPASPRPHRQACRIPSQQVVGLQRVFPVHAVMHCMDGLVYFLTGKAGNRPGLRQVSAQMSVDTGRLFSVSLAYGAFGQVLRKNGIKFGCLPVEVGGIEGSFELPAGLWMSKFHFFTYQSSRS